MPIKPETAQNLEELSSSVSPSRQKIISVLSDKKWFKNTDFETKKKLFTFPEDFDGYLHDLQFRKDEYGGMQVKRLKDLYAGNYAVLSVFEVMSLQTAQVFTHEYLSWKFGRGPGCRGLILFEEQGEIRYFLIRKSEKFALGESVLETIGTFIKYDSTSDKEIPNEIQHQIDKELGMKDVQIKKFINLGIVAADPVMVNSTPFLYAAVIDLPGDNDLKTLRSKVFKTKPISFQLFIEPIEKIWEYVNKSDESFFLAIVSRLTAMGILKSPA